MTPARVSAATIFPSRLRGLRVFQWPQRLAPWAAFFRRCAAEVGQGSYRYSYFFISSEKRFLPFSDIEFLNEWIVLWR
jgi:hypothetical protein